MPKFVLEIKKYKGGQFSYWTNKIKNFSKIYVLLPPGAESGEFFKNTITKFDTNSLVISIDYPGRGDSTPINKNDIKSISKYVDKYLSTFKFSKKIYLVGLSYGTAVATELVKIDSSKYKEVILIAPGEFIPVKYHLLIKTLFFPARLSENIRKFYRHIIVKYLPSIFAGFPTKNLKSILFQWLGILDYTIDTSFISLLPCTILAYNSDQFIRKGSLLKVKKVFPNSVILLEINDHHLNISTLSKRLLERLLD